ncbi:MAG: NADP-dependent oxidoreductase domain protein [Parcubacteria group bacterium GW2011_GWA2_47_26]|nr:MAG: NADP-dependent oxidoreductase domain protein [Parcubacteria group bacterium GW2011_GWA2_47_26]
MSLLVLGTVQLGMPYGVANVSGKPDQKVATEIVRAAWDGGIREFDTAQEYGESERVLGVAFQELGIANEVKVVSKLRKDINLDDAEAVINAVRESVERLGIPKLYGLLVHKEEIVDGWSAHNPSQPPLILRGGVPLVEHVGVSVYSPERALQAIETDGVSTIQIPANILDRRFEQAGVFKHARERGVEVYVRSVFLQGLLLMDSKNLPAHMKFARPVVERVEQLAQEFNITNQVLALQYVKTAFPDAHVIIGAETPQQVRDNVSVWNALPPAGIVERVREAFQSIDEKVLDPRQWPRL